MTQDKTFYEAPDNDAPGLSDPWVSDRNLPEMVHGTRRQVEVATRMREEFVEGANAELAALRTHDVVVPGRQEPVKIDDHEAARMARMVEKYLFSDELDWADFWLDEFRGRAYSAGRERVRACLGVLLGFGSA